MKINNKTIIKDDNFLLRKKSVEVNLPLSEEDKDILFSLIDYVRKSTNEKIALKEDLKPAVGIAAPQVGILKKMLAISFVDYDNNDNEILHEYALANPKVLSTSTMKSYLKHGEGCLSVEDIHKGFVYRNAKIKVRAYNLLEDKEIIIQAKGYLAIVLQHEIDHLNGILFYDHIDKLEPYRILENSICIE